MPLVKQGKFKEYYDRCKGIKKNAKEYHNEYFDEYDNYQGSGYVFSDYFYEVDRIYIEAVRLKTKLEDLLEISEQKTDKSVKKCKHCIKDMKEVINLCIEDFQRVYDSFQGNFTPLERETFHNYKIYKEI